MKWKEVGLTKEELNKRREEQKERRNERYQRRNREDGESGEVDTWHSVGTDSDTTLGMAAAPDITLPGRVDESKTMNVFPVSRTPQKKGSVTLLGDREIKVTEVKNGEHPDEKYLEAAEGQDTPVRLDVRPKVWTSVRREEKIRAELEEVEEKDLFGVATGALQTRYGRYSPTLRDVQQAVDEVYHYEAANPGQVLQRQMEREKVIPTLNRGGIREEAVGLFQQKEAETDQSRGENKENKESAIKRRNANDPRVGQKRSLLVAKLKEDEALLRRQTHDLLRRQAEVDDYKARLREEKLKNEKALKVYRNQVRKQRRLIEGRRAELRQQNGSDEGSTDGSDNGEISTIDLTRSVTKDPVLRQTRTSLPRESDGRVSEGISSVPATPVRKSSPGRCPSDPGSSRRSTPRLQAIKETLKGASSGNKGGSLHTSQRKGPSNKDQRQGGSILSIGLESSAGESSRCSTPRMRKTSLSPTPVRKSSCEMPMTGGGDAERNRPKYGTKFVNYRHKFDQKFSDGTREEYETFKTTFETMAHVMKWDSETSCAELWNAIRGKAATYLRTLSWLEVEHVESVWAMLDKIYIPPNYQRAVHDDFLNCRKKPTETMKLYCINLRNLYEQAHKDATEETVRNAIREQMFRYLDDTEFEVCKPYMHLDDPEEIANNYDSVVMQLKRSGRVGRKDAELALDTCRAVSTQSEPYANGALPVRGVRGGQEPVVYGASAPEMGRSPVVMMAEGSATPTAVRTICDSVGRGNKRLATEGVAPPRYAPLQNYGIADPQEATGPMRDIPTKSAMETRSPQENDTPGETRYRSMTDSYPQNRYRGMGPRDRKGYRPGAPPRYAPGNQRSGNYGSRPGHTPMKRPNWDSNRPMAPFTGKCWNCGEEGHTKRNCPLLRTPKTPTEDVVHTLKNYVKTENKRLKDDIVKGVAESLKAPGLTQRGTEC